MPLLVRLEPYRNENRLLRRLHVDPTPPITRTELAMENLRRELTLGGQIRLTCASITR